MRGGNKTKTGQEQTHHHDCSFSNSHSRSFLNTRNNHKEPDFVFLCLFVAILGIKNKTRRQKREDPGMLLPPCSAGAGECFREAVRFGEQPPCLLFT